MHGMYGWSTLPIKLYPNCVLNVYYYRRWLGTFNINRQLLFYYYFIHKWTKLCERKQQ